MELTRDQVWQLFTARLSGNLTAEQEHTILQWLKSNPEDEALYQQLSQMWESSPAPKLPQTNTDEQWKQLQSNMQKVSYVPMVMQPSVSFGRKYFWWMVAGLVLVAALGFLYNITFSHESSLEASVHNLELQEANLQPVWKHKVDADSLWKVRLTDGSKVWLNKGAKLYYTEDFNLQERRVMLIGEGYFEVTPDSTRPFVIKAGESETRVLGTAFNLKSDQKETQVQVVSGKVSFSPDQKEQELLLVAGETGQLANNKLTKDKQTDNHFLDWKHALDYRYEISHPTDFLSDNFRTKRSTINQTLIDGIIHNHAALATYKNIKLQVQYYHGKKEKMKSYEFTVYQAVGPGQTIDYRYRLADWFSQTDAVEVKIVDASVVKN